LITQDSSSHDLSC